MSKIGSNIRKIRTVKGLSQSQFAELFNLNRARIGAYEEGRAEPKIDVVLEIAKYFSIPLNEIFTKDLTVNQLTRFKLTQSESGSSKAAEADINTLAYLNASQILDRSTLEDALANQEELFQFPFPANTNGSNLWMDLTGVKLQNKLDNAYSAVLVNSKNTPKVGDQVIVIGPQEIAIGEYLSGKTHVKIMVDDNTEATELNNAICAFTVKLSVLKSLPNSSDLELRIGDLERRIERLEGEK